jgi:diguanylate cyclase (GGDEF)-like protein
MSDGEVFGNLCALDIKEYNFSDKDIEFLETMSVFLSHTIELESLAYKDPLTGLKNREFMKEYIYGLITSHFITMLFIDVDGFKNINDKFGHQIGDDILIQVSQRISDCLNKEDILIRYAGDEFIVIMLDIDIESSFEVSAKLINAFKPPFETEKGLIRLGISIGISQGNYPDESVDTLISKSDNAMYDSKKKGKNQFTHFQDIKQTSTKTYTL